MEKQKILFNNSKTQGDDDHSMNFLLEEELDLPKVGETRKGWIVAHRNNEILVDVGAKSEGVIPAAELQEMDARTRQMLTEGSEIIVFIVSVDDAQGNMIVSYTKAAAEKDWVELQEKKEARSICEGQVMSQNRGGWLVRVNQLTGFLPASQISRRQSTGKDDHLAAGQTVYVKILEIDPANKRLIVSEKAAEEERRQARRKDLLATIAEGDEYDGQVINLASFGAFVDIGQMEGLVHLSEISWKRINKPSDILKVGDKVRVQVLSVDEKNERLALSMKSLMRNPWEDISELYQTGQLLTANITKIAPFGAFARLNDDLQLEGLIHISELSENHITHASEVIKVGQEVTVRIIRVDAEQRQLGLSIKQVASAKFVDSDLEMFTSANDGNE
jgi:small subunit ribosomal protein S1